MTTTRTTATRKKLVVFCLVLANELQNLCHSGGIAPQGLEELRDLLGGSGEWSTRSIDPGGS